MNLDLLHFLKTYVGAFSLVTMGIPLLVIGLRGIVTKKPVFIPTRRQQLFAAILILPLVVDQLSYWWVPVLYIFSVIFLVIVTRGYSILGVTNESLRAGLSNSLTRLNLQYEDSSDGFRLPTLGTNLKTNTWGASGALRMKQRRFDTILHSIVREMKEYYQSSNEIEVKMGLFISYFALGVVGALAALLLAWFPSVSRV